MENLKLYLYTLGDFKHLGKEARMFIRAGAFIRIRTVGSIILAVYVGSNAGNEQAVQHVCFSPFCEKNANSQMLIYSRLSLSRR